MLFVTWDGPSSTYMEGLFMPIFNEIKKYRNIEFHIIQFTWADRNKTNFVKSLANDLGILYTSVRVCRKPHSAIGSLFTVYKGVNILKNYIKKHNIGIVMPRSTMPAIMLNRIKNSSFKVIFDADGLPLEERIENGSLSRDGKMYKLLFKEELKQIYSADAVVVRASHAIEHYAKFSLSIKDKVFVVVNGIDPDHFKPNQIIREDLRRELKIANDDFVLLYSGSLGEKYDMENMLSLYNSLKNNLQVKFVVLTNNINLFNNKFSCKVDNNVIVKALKSNQVGDYLNIADLALCLIKPTYAVKFVFPTKLGEYLLSGLPIIMTRNIGDFDQQGTDKDFVLFTLNNHLDNNLLTKILELRNNKSKTKDIREFGLEHFSLRKSAESYICAIDYVINN